MIKLTDIKKTGHFLKAWFIKNKIYFIAFAVPIVIMYTAYAIFGIYPFGDRSVLALDLNGQYVYFFEELRDAFWNSDKSALYSWSRNLSGGFMGIVGYYLASPFTLIVILLPEKMLLGSLLIMLLAKLGAAGVTFCYYLRKSKGLSEIHSLIFSTLYALCAYGVIQLMNPMWLDGMVFLPLIILGIEYICDNGKKLNFIIPLALMIISNFYIGYMICIFSALYYIVYALCISKKKSPKEILCSFIRMILSALTAVMCAAFMLLPVYNALKLGKFDFSEPDFSYKTQFRFGDFFAQFLTGQYDAVSPDGHPVIYCGIFTAMLVPLFFLNRKICDRRKIGYGILTAVLIFSMFIRPVDMVWHGFQMPIWMPFRYSFILSFIFLSMAAESFKNIKGIKLSSICVSFTAILIFFLVLLSRIKENDITEMMSKSIQDITKKDVYISIAFAAAYSIIIFIIRKLIKDKNGKIISVVIPSIIISLTCGELLYNCVDTLKCEDKDTLVECASSSSWYNYINNGREITNALYDYDNGFYRCEKTFHRKTNDNCAFGLRGITHFSSVMNAKTLKFIKAMGYAANTYYSLYNGETPLTDSLLGIKYTMDRNLKKNEGTNLYKRISDVTYNPVFSYEYTDENNEECVVDVYENPYALSIGFMADRSILNIEKIDSSNVFYNQNVLMSTVSGNTDLNNGRINSYNKYFRKIDVSPDKFLLNNVTASPYGDHTMYTAGNGDPTVDMSITVPSENPIYMYFESEYEKPVNLWLSSEQDNDGNYINYKLVNTYFDVYTHCAMCLGSFKAGDVINLRMTVTNEFTIVKDFLFYEFDENLFAESIDKLKQNQWELKKTNGRVLEGTITAEKGKIMLTSIPYESGWTVTVDGKKTDYMEVAQSLIGIELTEGKHTVKMSYTPPGLIVGVIVSLVGFVFTAMIYMYDRKNKGIKK